MACRLNRPEVLVLATLLLGLGSGCSQSEDVLTPIYQSTFTLTPRLLPASAPGMIYELWLVDGGDTTSIARFDYDPFGQRFVTEDGATRPEGGAYTVHGDLLRFDAMLVSVERRSDPEPTSPGPIMLADRVTDPESNPIRLVFPESDELWHATCRFNLETPTDGSRATNDGAGLWFCNYEERLDSLGDTIIDRYIFERTVVLTIGDSDCVTSAKSATVEYFDTLLVFGFDTLPHRSFRIALEETTSCDPPYVIYKTDRHDTCYSYTRFVWDKFGQDDYALVEFDRWHYKGWVIAPPIAAAGASGATFSPPAWPSNTTSLILGETDGGMLSTGTFKKVDLPDDANPYSFPGPRVFPYPGDDFMQDLPNGAAGPLNLMPQATGNTGAVFITLEPDNIVDTTTNFPLVVLAAPLPADRSLIARTYPTFPMTLCTNTNNSSLGFPRIDVSVFRQ